MYDQRHAGIPAKRRLRTPNGYGGRLTARPELHIPIAEGSAFYVDGAAAISRIHLPLGAPVLLVFTASGATLVNGSRLLVPGGSITVAAGDSAWVWPIRDDIVRVVGYTRADGTTLVGGTGNLRYDMVQGLSSGQKAQAQENIGLPPYAQGWGLQTAYVSTTSVSVAAGVEPDSGRVKMISLAAITKTTGSWAVGSGNGALDVGTIEASKWYYIYGILRSDTGVTDVALSLAPGTAASVNISSASPGVVTWTDHGLQANAPVMFTTPPATGLAVNTQYYVKTVLSADTFTVSATQGGSAINTSGSASGVTAISKPVLLASYDYYALIGFARTNGSSQLIKWLHPDRDVWKWDVAQPDVSDPNPGATAKLRTVSVPPGREIEANMSIGGAAGSGTGYDSRFVLTSPAQTAAAFTNSTQNYGGSGPVQIWNFVREFTNRSSQIRTQHYQSDASTQIWINTIGWKWARKN